MELSIKTISNRHLYQLGKLPNKFEINIFQVLIRSLMKNISKPPLLQKPKILFDKMQNSATLPRINEPASPNKLFPNKFRDYKGVESLDNIRQDMTKSMSPTRLPLISPKLKEISLIPFASNKMKTQSEEVINLDKFVIKTIKKPEFVKNNKNEMLPDEDPFKATKRKSVFSNNVSRCPFAIQETKERIFIPVKELTSLKNKNESETTTGLESLWNLFSSPVFSYVILDFEQKVQKVPQLAKYFQNVDINKIFQGKLEFFKGNIGKRDMSMRNHVLLEAIHKKMNISDDDFDVFKGFFSIVMREHNIEEDLISEFLNFVEKFRKDIVSETNILQKAFKDIPNFEEKLINIFREKINSNHLVNNYFSEKDVSFQNKHCKAILTFLCNGSQGDYQQKIRMSHKDCVITDHNFYYFKQCLQHSLRECRKDQSTDYFSSKDISKIGDLLEDTRLSVLNQKSFFEIFSANHKFEEMISYFLNMIMQKPILKELFSKSSSDKQKKHVELMLTFVLGGHTKYTKRDMTPAHYNLNITLEHYEQMRKALEETLINFKVENNDCVYILAELDSLKYNFCNEKSLLHRMGGTKTIDFIINSFYLKAFQNPELSGYFKNTDIKTMIANQKFWFTNFFDNANIKPYHFKDLRTFHLGMGLTEDALNCFMKTLVEGLQEFGHKDGKVIREAVSWLGRCKNDILDLH